MENRCCRRRVRPNNGNQLGENAGTNPRCGCRRNNECTAGANANCNCRRDDILADTLAAAYNQGYREGYNDGYNDGFTGGRDQGYVEGYRQGVRDTNERTRQAVLCLAYRRRGCCRRPY